MFRFGHARVSSTDQDFAIRLEKLKAAGCTVTRSEKYRANPPTTGPNSPP